MKFDPTKFRLPGFFRRLLQNRQMKYVLLAVAFSALIIGAAVIYGELSKRYEQEIQPPVHTEQTMKTKPGTKVTNEKRLPKPRMREKTPQIPPWRVRQQRILKNRLKKKRSEFRVQQGILSAIPAKRLHKSHRRFPERHSNRRTRKNRRMRKNQIIQRILPVLQSRDPECQIQNRLLRNNRKQPLLKQILP